jgi:3-oxoacyl-[acyl-carrier-protein] synthase-3
MGARGFSMGIMAAGMYLPERVMTAAEISEQSGLPEWVVHDKLGIERKHVPEPGVHPNMMAVRAARSCLERANVDASEIDVVLCTTEEWKEYTLWTAGIDLAHEIGASNAWAIDIHMRCATTIAALKLARSLMRDDNSVDTVLIAGGYAVADFIDYSNLQTSFMFNIGAGAGALLVRRGWPENRVLGTHLISDGSMSRHVVVPASGTVEHPTDEAVARGRFKFDLVKPEEMKRRLADVSIENWMRCVDEALRKSGVKSDGSPYGREDLEYLNMLLVKPSAHRQILELLGISEDKSYYLGHIGHIGEQDAIISMIEGERSGALEEGDLMVILGAGIGYVWGAGVVQWGPQATEAEGT